MAVMCVMGCVVRTEERELFVNGCMVLLTWRGERGKEGEGGGVMLIC